MLHLHNYYEYEIKYNVNDKRKLNYHIIKKIKEYEPLKGKKAKQNEIYSKCIIEVIKNDPLQTAKNVSRIIENNKEIVALKHKSGTIYEYTRVNMRNMFGKGILEGGTEGIILEKKWCILDAEKNKYLPLMEEQVRFLYDTFKSYNKENCDKDISIYADYDSGLITEEEMKENIKYCRLENFLLAKNEFKNRYGHHPIKVPVYGFSGF